MLIGQLHQSEDIEYLTSLPKNYESMLINRVHVGTLITPRMQSTACLLSDGTVLTCLHSICDFERIASKEPIRSCYDDLNKVKIYFVKNNNIYVFNVIELIHDGAEALIQYGSQASTFDYARLKLDGEPLSELGAGLELDQTQHFTTSYTDDPPLTLAISGPQLYTKENKQYSSRTVSVSQNEAAFSQYYMFPQMGAHPTKAGLSGQATFPLTATYQTPNKILYALHSVYDRIAGLACGVKISEYRLAQSIFEKQYLSPKFGLSSAPSFVKNPSLEYQGLRRNGDDRKDILSFLDSLRNHLDSGKPITIPASLKADYIDSHQPQHVVQGLRSDKSYFLPSLATSSQSETLIALANCVNKLISEFCKEHPDVPKRDTNFIINLGFHIGYDKEVGKNTSCVSLYGFYEKPSPNARPEKSLYHVFPKEPVQGQNYMLIDAFSLLEADSEKQRNKIPNNTNAGYTPRRG